MSKNKLTKFAELDNLSNVFQYPYSVLQSEGGFPYKGQWHREIFGNDHPIIVELGCGRGEYTVELARQHPERNYIGVDIKGNRMWSGATEADRMDLQNVRFLRTQVELLDQFFGPDEISEIWLTFPDPQMRKQRKRMTATNFLLLYESLLRSPKTVHLKTDSNFLYQYTREVARANALNIVADLDDVHSQADSHSELRQIQTYYESQWLARGMEIKYLQIQLEGLPDTPIEPDVDIPWDSYRSYCRRQRSQLEKKS